METNNTIFSCTNNVQVNQEKTEREQKEKFSYSKLSVFDKCPYQFKLKYEDKNFSSASSLALEIGTIAHKCMELVALDIMAGKKPDYQDIMAIFMDGYDIEEPSDEGKDKGLTHIPGADELKMKYAFQWIEEDTKSGLTYPEKIRNFFNHLTSIENDTVWKPIAVELPFSFEFEGNTISGFIDRVDINKDGDYRVVDYKTSKAVYLEKDVKTAMQMVIYDFAIKNIFGKAPIEHLYDFVFINKTQYACYKGYEKRGEAKLEKWFSGISQSRDDGNYKPNPSPLCHWCDFCEHNASAEEELKHLCPYYSLWTPSNKVYKVNKPYVQVVKNNSDSISEKPVKKVKVEVQRMTKPAPNVEDFWF